MRSKELWSVFVHPLSTLISDDLGLYIDQVVSLVQNTGTTYASTELVFGVDEETTEDMMSDYQGDLLDDDEEEAAS